MSVNALFNLVGVDVGRDRVVEPAVDADVASLFLLLLHGAVVARLGKVAQVVVDDPRRVRVDDVHVAVVLLLLMLLLLMVLLVLVVVLLMLLLLVLLVVEVVLVEGRGVVAAEGRRGAGGARRGR